MTVHVAIEPMPMPFLYSAGFTSRTRESVEDEKLLGLMQSAGKHTLWVRWAKSPL